MIINYNYLNIILFERKLIFCNLFKKNYLFFPYNRVATTISKTPNDNGKIQVNALWSSNGLFAFSSSSSIECVSFLWTQEHLLPLQLQMWSFGLFKSPSPLSLRFLNMILRSILFLGIQSCGHIENFFRASKESQIRSGQVCLSFEQVE